jgi:hypothetical protein
MATRCGWSSGSLLRDLTSANGIEGLFFRSFSMVEIFFRSSRPPSIVIPGPNTGVATASRAPQPMASKTLAAFPSTVAVTTRIALGVSFMILPVACTPSMTGMIRSIRMRSGRSWRHFSTASRPFTATQARACSGAWAMTLRRTSRARGMSLTIAIRMVYDSPIRSLTARRSVSSWKLLFVR